LSEVFLHGAKGGNTLAPMPVPERLTFAAPGTPSGEAINVGQMYTLFAQAIRDGESHQPTFETAVDLHRLVDAIKQASDNGRSRGDVRVAARLRSGPAMMRAGRQRHRRAPVRERPRDTLKFEDVSDRAIKHLTVNVQEMNWFSTYHVHHRVTEHPAGSR
jgi:hypothetical protein